MIADFQDREQISHWVAFITQAQIDSPFPAIHDIAMAVITRSAMKMMDNDWDSYHKLVPIDVALPRNFAQSFIIPRNNFQPGMKLETVNQACQKCVATVIDIDGPRIRLALSPTLSAWTICDSDNICPLPPGFQGAAPREIFHPQPQMPYRNLFKLGDKLEAVSRTNPTRVVPAIVLSICEVYLSVFVPSECYMFICHYRSRNIFPIGWCKRANLALSTPNHSRLHIPYILNKIMLYSYHTQTRNKLETRGIYIPLPPDPYGALETWSVNDVAKFLSSCEPMIAVYAETFQKANVDGLVLIFISPQTMWDTMGLKIGPALKIRLLVNILAGKPWQSIDDR